MMRIDVEAAHDVSGGAVLKRFRLGERTIAVVELLDSWQGADADHFRIRGDDGHTYVLKHAHLPTGAAWEMVSFTHRDSQGTHPDLPAATTILQ